MRPRENIKLRILSLGFKSRQIQPPGHQKRGSRLFIWNFVITTSHNWHQVDEQLYRSAQAYGRYFNYLLKRNNIKSLVNLRGENPRANWYGPERTICAELNINHIDLSLHSRRLPKKTTLVKLLKIFNTADRPILLKCSGGADRTGLAATLFLLNEYGIENLPNAVKQVALFPYLHLPRKHQRWIKYFPQYFAQTHKGQQITDWTQEVYSHTNFAEWLCKNKLDGTWHK